MTWMAGNIGVGSRDREISQAGKLRLGHGETKVSKFQDLLLGSGLNETRGRIPKNPNPTGHQIFSPGEEYSTSAAP